MAINGDGGNIYAVGDEFVVNTQTAGGQRVTAATDLAGGGFAVTWYTFSSSASGYVWSIMARTVDPAGSFVEFEVVNSTSGIGNAVVEGLADGSFVIAWQANEPDGQHLYAQIYDASGTAVGDRLLIAHSAYDASITALDDGGFAIAWVSADSFAYGISGQFFAADGTATGAAFQVNTYTDFQQEQPAITQLANGNVLVTWATNYNDIEYQAEHRITSQLFTPDGERLGSEIQTAQISLGLGHYTYRYWDGLQTTALEGGRFVVSWYDPEDDRAYFQIHEANGALSGGRMSFASYNQDAADIVAISTGGFVASWTVVDTTTGVQSLILREYDANGGIVGTDYAMFQANSGSPILASTAEGLLMLAWSEPDGDGPGVAAQMFNVGPYNIAPTGTDAVLTLDEDGSYVLNVGDFGFADGDGNTLASIVIATLPTAGTLTFDGAAVTEGQVISAADIAVGLLVFSPAAEASGAAYASFTFQVQDDGTAPSGSNTDASPNTITFDVNAVNDSPVAVADVLAATEDTEVTYAAADLLGNDTDLDGDTLVIASVENAVGGRVVLNEEGTVTFTPAADFNGTASFDYTISDGNGGTSRATATIALAAIDDAPVARDDNFATGDTAPIVGRNLFADHGQGADFDADGPALSVATVNGLAANVGSRIALASGAFLTVRADGTFDYDPNGAFEYLSLGQNASDSFTYQLAGGGAATATISISGNDNADVVTGTHGADIIDSGAGDDTVYGMEGDDILNGNGGWDDLFGGSGNDTLYGGTGRDFLDGGADADVLVGGDHNDIYVVDSMSDQVFEYEGGGVDEVRTNLSSYSLQDMSHVENLTGTSDLGQTLTGNAARNQITGGNGEDILRGLSGNDTIFGGSGSDRIEGGDWSDRLFGEAGWDHVFGGYGNDLLDGGNGNDVLSGGFGNDRLFGGNHDDRLNGGAGADRLSGGAGSDLFVFSDLDGSVDTIVDFSITEDMIHLNRVVFAELQWGGLSSDAFVAGTEAQDADDRISYDKDTGRIFYDADGAGGEDAVLFAAVTAGLDLSASDFFVFGG